MYIQTYTYSYILQLLLELKHIIIRPKLSYSKFFGLIVKPAIITKYVKYIKNIWYVWSTGK